jgi:hypothetical protein
MLLATLFSPFFKCNVPENKLHKAVELGKPLSQQDVHVQFNSLEKMGQEEQQQQQLKMALDTEQMEGWTVCFFIKFQFQID